MNCKNCQTPQRTDFNYCPNCGAKVVHHRLSFKNLTYDITERYFNLDNTFIKTVVQLCVRPEVVIDSYIQGVRRKFLNPISHIGIALTLAGLMIFIMQKVLTPDIMNAYGGQLSEAASKKVFDTVFDYTSFLFVMYIPVFAFAGYVTFNRKDYLLSEYIIAYIYIMSQWSIITFPISLVVLLISPSSYMSLSFPLLFILLLYCIFVMQRIHRLTTGAMILRAMVFSILAILGYFGIVMVFYVVMFLTGTFELQDFIPQK